LPSRENDDALFEALHSDRDSWVKYGSIRSLVEHAARSAPQREGVLGRLKRDVERLRREHHVLRELQSALLIQPEYIDASNPAEWKDAVTPLVETYHDAESSASGRERWQRVAYELRKAYGESRQ